MDELLSIINPPVTVRAWIYRVCLLVAVIVVSVALIFGHDASTIIATATSIVAILSSALATLNTDGPKILKETPDEGRVTAELLLGIAGVAMIVVAVGWVTGQV